MRIQDTRRGRVSNMVPPSQSSNIVRCVSLRSLDWASCPEIIWTDNLKDTHTSTEGDRRSPCCWGAIGHRECHQAQMSLFSLFFGLPSRMCSWLNPRYPTCIATILICCGITFTSATSRWGLRDQLLGFGSYSHFSRPSSSNHYSESAIVICS